MKHTISETKDYSVFVSHDHQQPMSDLHVRRIMESMKSSGFWKSKPISVVQDGDNLIVCDGHHRVAAAKQLNIPVFYVVEEPDMFGRIGIANTTVRIWHTRSFVKMYADTGNLHYVELASYLEKGIPLKHAASMLRGESSHSFNCGKDVRRGAFRVKTRTSIDTVVRFLDEVGPVCNAVKSSIFIEALSSLLFVPEFDVQTLRNRIMANPLQLQKCNNRHQMISQLEEVYNFRAREKVPLKHLVEAKMKERSELFGK